jgi:hypothetical protein
LRTDSAAEKGINRRGQRSQRSCPQINPDGTDYANGVLALSPAVAESERLPWVTYQQHGINLEKVASRRKWLSANDTNCREFFWNPPPRKATADRPQRAQMTFDRIDRIYRMFFCIVPAAQPESSQTRRVWSRPQDYICPEGTMERNIEYRTPNIERLKLRAKAAKVMLLGLVDSWIHGLMVDSI